jgi:multisubunit Na+/H+ antiporter MnhG subunit
MALAGLIVCFLGVLVGIFADVWSGLCSVGLGLISIAASVHNAVERHRIAEAKEAEKQRLLKLAKEAQEQKEKQEQEWLERQKNLAARKAA